MPSVRRSPLWFLLIAVIGVGTPFAGAHAQRDTLATIRGTVRTATGVPIEEVLVQLRNDTARIAESRTLRSGGFTLPRVPVGTYTLDVRRVGYESRVLPLTVERGGPLPFDLTLVPLPVVLDAITTDTPWSGVIGVVGDYATMEPLGGVRVRPLDGADATQSDAAGRFAFRVADGGTGALLVEQAGRAPRLVSYVVPPGERAEVVVLLDSSRTSRTDGWIWKDLAQRHRWSTPRSVRVSRAELLATGAHNLMVALENAPTVQQSGLIFSRGACMYVNGQPRPGFPLDAILADRVEYVEGYALRGDLSRTLQLRWPRGADCGAPGGDLTVRRAIEGGQGIQYVVVWLR
jgi:hypothetical protein